MSRLCFIVAIFVFPSMPFLSLLFAARFLRFGSLFAVAGLGRNAVNRQVFLDNQSSEILSLNNLVKVFFVYIILQSMSKGMAVVLSFWKMKMFLLYPLL